MKNSILTEYDEAFVLNQLSQESYEDGLQAGEERFARLTQLLLAESKTKDLESATSNLEYRKQLFKKYNL